MKVWFGTTTTEWFKYKAYYYEIRNYLRSLGCEVLYDWLENVDERNAKKPINRNIRKIFEEVISAIDLADAVVIEYTVPNFSSSHQINLALLKKKPTLVLRLNKDNPRYADSYLEALQSPYLKIKEYTPETYKEIVKEFIGFTKIKQGQQRYNIVLDYRQKQYLDWASVKYNKSRSAIIRELVDEKVDKDKLYKDFLYSFYS